MQEDTPLALAPAPPGGRHNLTRLRALGYTTEGLGRGEQRGGFGFGGGMGMADSAPMNQSGVAQPAQPRTEAEKKEAYSYYTRRFGDKLQTSSGKIAVENSELVQEQLQNAQSMSTQNRIVTYGDQGGKSIQQIRGVRYVGNQAFFQEGPNWISTQYDAKEKKKVIQVKPYSEAYFQLANISKDVSNILALGSNISFVQNGFMVEITEKGLEKLTKEQLKQLTEKT